MCTGTCPLEGGYMTTLTTVGQTMKRLNLALPEKLVSDLQQLADDEGTSLTELLRRFIKLGLLVVRLQNHPEDGVFIREGGQDKKIYIL